MSHAVEQIKPWWEIAQGESVRFRMTEQEFLEWYETYEHKAEWVDGEVIIMSPVRDEHDCLQWWLRNLLQFYTERHDLGQVRGPQVTCRMIFRGKRVARRDPDVLFVARDRCDLIHDTHVDGAPDLALEIVSPSSVDQDWRDKYGEYESAGVREYWVVDPLAQRVEAYSLNVRGEYEAIAHVEKKIASKVIPGWYVKPEWLWQKKLPDVLQALAELGVR